jgi:hypothetical protein
MPIDPLLLQVPLAPRLVPGSYLAEFQDTAGQFSNKVSSTFYSFETKIEGRGHIRRYLLLTLIRIFTGSSSNLMLTEFRFLKHAPPRINKGKEGN